jgi:DNA invertase Pin-like site-specific DNA recombinase
MINERRAEGQARARAAGKHMGRSAELSAEQVATLHQRAATESKTALTEEYGVSRATLYAAIKACELPCGLNSGSALPIPTGTALWTLC